MKRAIVTSHEGEEFERIAAITLPRIAAYAERHGLDHIEVEPPAFIRRPPSWKKLVAICEAFVDHDEVLWLDTDVVIVDGAENIFDAVPAGAAHAMVRHFTNEGDVPNAGVWLLRRPMLSVLASIAMVDAVVHHRWWEQAALLALMGFVEADGLCTHSLDTPLYADTAWLDESWNVWRGSPGDTAVRFRHACGLAGEDRIKAIEGWAHAAAT